MLFMALCDDRYLTNYIVLSAQTEIQDSLLRQIVANMPFITDGVACTISIIEVAWLFRLSIELCLQSRTNICPKSKHKLHQGGDLV